jgi:hypothetical protein
VNTLTGWKGFWRRWLGWMPVQFCMVCGKAYWGGWPQWEWRDGRLTNIWQAWFMDYCSTKCCEQDWADEEAARQ